MRAIPLGISATHANVATHATPAETAESQKTSALQFPQLNSQLLLRYKLSLLNSHTSTTLPTPNLSKKRGATNLTQAKNGRKTRRIRKQCDPTKTQMTELCGARGKMTSRGRAEAATSRHRRFGGHLTC